MASRPFSKAVLMGLESLDMSHDEIAEVTGLSRKRIEAIFQGKLSLRDSHLEKIEIASGKTAGQLAIIGAGIKDKALSEIMDKWAKTAESLRGKPKRSRVAVG